MREAPRILAVCLFWLLASTVPGASAQLLVAQDGSGTHATIQGALNASRFGDTIIVKPGTYEEGIRFRNGVQLIGSGAAATTIRFGYGFDPVVQVSHASSGRIEGFTIERTGSTLASSAVRLESASITIARCTIQGAQQSGIEVLDATSGLTLVDATVRSNGGNGVWAQAGAGIDVSGCTIEANGGAGLLLSDASSGAVRDTVFRSNGASGIELSDEANATLSGGRLEANRDWGIILAYSATMTVNGAAFAQNADGGVLVEDDASVSVDHTVLDGGAVAVRATDHASVTLRNSTIRDAVGIGVEIRDRATADIDRVEVDSCGDHGIRLASEEASDVRHATVVRGGGSGILIEGAHVSVVDSIAAYNEGVGLDVRRSAGEATVLLLSHNDVWGNRGGEYEGAVLRSTDLSAPPEFANLSAGDLSLRLDSPCIGRGSLGETIGAHPDPKAEASAVVELLPFLHRSVLGLDMGALIRVVRGPPLELQTIEAFATYEQEPWSIDVRTSLAGVWGRRTSGRLAFAPGPWESENVRSSLEVALAGVLDGVESWGSASFGAELAGAWFALTANLGRTWPSTAWSQEASLQLGRGIRLHLAARALDFSPRDLQLGLERRVENSGGASSFRGTLSLGEEKSFGFRATWEQEVRTIAADVSAYLDHLNCISMHVDIDEADAAFRLAARVADGRLADGSVSVSKGFGATVLGFGLGVNGDGHARASARLEVGFGPSPTGGPNLLPVPSFVVYPADPQSGDPVSFDAAGSADPDGRIVDYWWDYGDGDAELGLSVTHVFAAPGTYDVALTVVDEDGSSATVVRPLDIWPANSGPVASFVWEPVSVAGTRLPRAVRSTDRIRLDASESYDPTKADLEYHWDLNSDGAFDLVTDSPIAVVDPMPAGSRPVTLRVVSPTGRADAVMHAIVIGEPKAPQALFSVSPAAPSVLDPIRFSDLSLDVDGRIVAWEWSFGDGHTSREVAPVHRYEEAARYDVRLTVTDDDGLDDTHRETLDVALVPEVTPVSAVWVLAIGLSDYDSVPDLQFGRDDALSVAAWALRENVPADHIRLLTDNGDASALPIPVEAKRATLLNVREALGWLRRVSSSDDLVLIFFSGHGYQGLDDGSDERDGVDEFFVLADTIEGAIDDTALRDDEFGRFLDRLDSRHVLVFFDGCHSGGLARSLPSGQRPVGDVADIFRDFNLDGRLIFSAATETQEAFESAALGHGVFTYFVLQGLAGGADLNGDRRITAWELYEFLLAEVPAFVKRERGVEQIPQIVGEGDVRVLVSRRPDDVTPSFSYWPTVPFAGGPVRFYDETVEDHAVLTWSFGDGSTSSDSAPTHVYEAEGTYDVFLSVRRDPAGPPVDVVLAIAVGPPGRVIDQIEEGWIISLGERNGLEPGDRLLALDDAAEPTDVVLEVIEVLGSDAVLCRTDPGASEPRVGDVVRVLSDASAR